MKDIKGMIAEKLGRLRNDGVQILDGAIDENIIKIRGDIEKRVRSMTSGGGVDAAMEQLQRTRVNESEYLMFISDERKLTPLTMFAFGLFLVCLLPGWAKLIPVLVFISALASLYFSYIKECAINVEKGFQGVITEWGHPTGETQTPGRKWYWSLKRYCTFQVSTMDLFADVNVASFTLDFGKMSISPNVVFEISDYQKFLKTTTAAGCVKIMKLYGTYIGLRLITSMTARSKFIGTKNMDNFRQALDEVMQPYGIRVKYVTLPNVTNPVLDDLEQVQTQLRRIGELNIQKKAERENAIKTIESEIRQKTKATRGTSNEMNQIEIQLDTILSSEINSAKQNLIVEARSRLITAHSAMSRDIDTFMAKVDKARAMANLLTGLETKYKLELARAKRVAYEMLVPEEVHVVNVAGMEAGILMNFAGRILNGGNSIPPSQPRLPLEAPEA